MNPSDRSIGRNLIRAVALAICILAGAWMCYLAFSGGRDFEIFGRTISSHDPRRPLLVFVVALSVWLLSTRAVSVSPGIFPLRSFRIDDRLLGGGLALAVLVIGLQYGTMVAGGADSYGYISQAQLWAQGRLTIPQPWAKDLPWPDAAQTFAPFGYQPALDRLGIVPTYPPGLPILMAGASIVAGHCAMFWVVPISGAALAFGTFLLGRRLGSSRGGLAAAALVASSPVVLFMLSQPLSDVPAAAAWTLALLLLSYGTAWSAGGAGLAAAVAILIRPNLSPLALIPAAWLLFNVARAAVGTDRTLRVRQLGAYLVALAPGIAVVAWLNWHLYGSPLMSGYGGLDILFSWSNVLPNARNYLTWFVEVETVLPLAGLAALIVPRTAKWTRPADHGFVSMLGAFVGVLLLEYLLYGVFDAWWYLRFLLPAWPLIMLGFGQLAWRLARVSTSAAVIVALVIAALVIRGTVVAANRFSFVFWQGEHRYVEIAHLVRDATEQASVILSGQHAGSLRHYGSRLTLNYSALQSGWLDQAVTWFEQRGVQPYALLEDFEVTEFKARFAGQEKVSLLDAQPILVHSAAGTTTLFGLGRLPRTQPVIQVREIPFTGRRCTPPAPQPRLVLK